jgi:hypothetical protein
MVLDPLSALSVAGNVVQFTEFTINLLSKSRKIFKSEEGALIENLELEAVTRNLAELSGRIRETFPSQTQEQMLTYDDVSLKNLCDSCISTAEELLAVLRKLRLQGRHEKWTSFRNALKTMLSENELNDLSRKLERYRRQLDTQLLASLRYVCLINFIASKVL